MRNCARELHEGRRRISRQRSRAEPFASWTTPRLRLPVLLGLRVAVEALVFGVILTCLSQLLRLRLGIDVAKRARLLRGLRVIRLAIRGRGTNQKTAQQNDCGQGDFPMGHDASTPEVSNHSTIWLSP